jgi:hypothetical protein
MLGQAKCNECGGTKTLEIRGEGEIWRRKNNKRRNIQGGEKMKVEHAPDCPNPVTIEKLVRIPRRYQDPKDPDTPEHIIVHFCPNCGAGVVLGFAV